MRASLKLGVTVEKEISPFDVIDDAPFPHSTMLPLLAAGCPSSEARVQ